MAKQQLWGKTNFHIGTLWVNGEVWKYESLMEILEESLVIVSTYVLLVNDNTN